MDNDHQDLIAENVRLFRRIIELEREQAHITAAAEVGDDPVTHLNPWVLDEMKRREAATIERCAQVADTATITVGDATETRANIAAAIRSLKDK